MDAKSVKEKVDKAKESTKQWISKNPISSVCAALGVGVLVGLMVRRCKR